MGKGIVVKGVVVKGVVVKGVVVKGVVAKGVVVMTSRGCISCSGGHPVAVRAACVPCLTALDAPWLTFPAP